MKGSLIEIAAQKDKANSIKPDEIQSEGDDVLLTHSGSGNVKKTFVFFVLKKISHAYDYQTIACNI